MRTSDALAARGGAGGGVCCVDNFAIGTGVGFARCVGFGLGLGVDSGLDSGLDFWFDPDLDLDLDFDLDFDFDFAVGVGVDIDSVPIADATMDFTAASASDGLGPPLTKAAGTSALGGGVSFTPDPGRDRGVSFFFLSLILTGQATVATRRSRLP